MWICGHCQTSPLSIASLPSPDETFTASLHLPQLTPLSQTLSVGSGASNYQIIGFTISICFIIETPRPDVLGQFYMSGNTARQSFSFSFIVDRIS